MENGKRNMKKEICSLSKAVKKKNYKKYEKRRKKYGKSRKKYGIEPPRRENC